jgi:predicted enzyme related to lactoylglutathione lyase
MSASYVEHVAIRVKDIQWHIRFFEEVLGQTLREMDGTADAPNQYWTIGGMQLMSCPEMAERPSNEHGWLAHLGIMCEDQSAAIAAAKTWGATVLPQGGNWLQLPDGLAIELLQASPGSVAQIHRINPRA